MFKKFQNNFILSINGLTKEVYKSTLEDGEGEQVATHDTTYINKNFEIKGDEMTGEKIQEILLNHLKKYFFVNDDFKLEYLCISDNDYIQFSTLEDKNAFPIDGNEEDYKNDVYSCYHTMELQINGKNVDNEDLRKIFNMCE